MASAGGNKYKPKDVLLRISKKREAFDAKLMEEQSIIDSMVAGYRLTGIEPKDFPKGLIEIQEFYKKIEKNVNAFFNVINSKASDDQLTSDRVKTLDAYYKFFTGEVEDYASTEITKKHRDNFVGFKPDKQGRKINCKTLEKMIEDFQASPEFATTDPAMYYQVIDSVKGARTRLLDYKKEIKNKSKAKILKADDRKLYRDLIGSAFDTDKKDFYTQLENNLKKIDDFFEQVKNGEIEVVGNNTKESMASLKVLINFLTDVNTAVDPTLDSGSLDWDIPFTIKREGSDKEESFTLSVKAKRKDTSKKNGEIENANLQTFLGKKQNLIENLNKYKTIRNNKFISFIKSPRGITVGIAAALIFVMGATLVSSWLGSKVNVADDGKNYVELGDVNSAESVKTNVNQEIQNVYNESSQWEKIYKNGKDQRKVLTEFLEGIGYSVISPDGEVPSTEDIAFSPDSGKEGKITAIASEEGIVNENNYVNCYELLSYIDSSAEWIKGKVDELNGKKINGSDYVTEDDYNTFISNNRDNFVALGLVLDKTETPDVVTLEKRINKKITEYNTVSTSIEDYIIDNLGEIENGLAGYNDIAISQSVLEEVSQDSFIEWRNASSDKAVKISLYDIRSEEDNGNGTAAIQLTFQKKNGEKYIVDGEVKLHGYHTDGQIGGEELESILDSKYNDTYVYADFSNETAFAQVKDNGDKIYLYGLSNVAPAGQGSIEYIIYDSTGKLKAQGQTLKIDNMSGTWTRNQILETVADIVEKEVYGQNDKEM